MSEPRLAADHYGITVHVANLGDWGGATLISEYDPRGPAIRINERAIERYRRLWMAGGSGDVRTLVDFAIAHELYHHREAIGEIRRLATHRQREAAADTFARTIAAVDARLETFLTAGLRAGL